jgi:hypothetical protein
MFKGDVAKMRAIKENKVHIFTDVISPTHDLIALAGQHDCVLRSVDLTRLILGFTCARRAAKIA